MMLDRYGRNFDHSIIAILDKSDGMTKNALYDIISVDDKTSGGNRMRKVDQTAKLQRMQEQGKEVSYMTELRMRAGLSQTELAKAVGSPQPYIARIESGDIDMKNVCLEKAVLLAKALGVTAEELLPEE